MHCIMHKLNWARYKISEKQNLLFLCTLLQHVVYSTPLCTKINFKWPEKIRWQGDFCNTMKYEDLRGLIQTDLRIQHGFNVMKYQ